MCGIFCSIYRPTIDSSTHVQSGNLEINCDPHKLPCFKIKESLSRRGPNTIQEVKTKLSGDWSGCFMGSVLWTQGSQPVKQPLQDNRGNVLLWNGDVLHGPLEGSEQCDSEVVFEQLQHNPLDAIVNISGPYAFVFWHSGSKRLWFGRDVFGRQSLLWSVFPLHLTLSSVSHRHTDLTEVPAFGIFMLDLSANQQVEIHFFPWAHLATGSFSAMSDVPVLVKESLVHAEVGDMSSRLRWLGREPAENDLVGYSVSGSSEALLQDSAVRIRVDRLLDILTGAVACRVNKQPGVCKNCTQRCNHCSVAVLFSGGLDSTVLALLANKFVPEGNPIDLYNIAFQQQNGSFEVPDRITGRASLQELRDLTPKRLWNFIQIDVSQEELSAQRKQRITDLIHPLASVLDDSLGCALWFAARGQGSLDGHPYVSPARVVLVGMGADEQLGGYTRHRSTLRHSGSWAALGHELTADTDNISYRNLGRDNRIVSDHGRQPRIPFLDERVVAYLNTLPPWHRCVPTTEWPPGKGDKLLLRLVAQQLGLSVVATLPKRAMQFGCRIANRKEKGSQISERL